MTEQVFLKEFHKMPENVKQELLLFFEFLIGKYNIQVPARPASPQNGSNPEKKSPKAGFLKGTFVMSEDFDAPLEDFKEYME